MITIIMSKELSCLQCGYSWEPRKKKPKECPDCKSRKWDKNEKRTAEN